MDKKDEKIIAELITNSRIPLSQLGKKIGASREVVTYRINKLIEEKIITDFYPIINIGSLGYSRNGCLIQLKDIDEEKEKIFFSFLKKHPFVTYAGVVVGKWNVAFDILSRDRAHLIEVIKEITDEGGKYIETYFVTNNSAEEEIYPVKVMGLSEKNKSLAKLKQTNLDTTDKNLLDLFSVNSRMDYVSLSSELHLTSNAIKYRIKQLEKTGVIQGYTISVDVTKLGYEFYNMQIKLDTATQEDKLKEFLRRNPRVVYFYKYLGNENWDIDIGILAKNSRDLREVIMEFRKEVGGAKIHDIYATLDIIKANVAPKGIFQS